MVISVHCFLLLLLLYATLLGHQVLGKAQKDATAQLVVYNRVPKTGSTTVQALIDKLAERNGFTALHYVAAPEAKYEYLHNVRFFKQNVTRKEVKKFANSLWSLQQQAGQNVIVDYHFPFVNFKSVGAPAPLHFNIVREPVERLLSHYFYDRYGKRNQTRREEVLEKHGGHSIDECLDIYMFCKCSGGCYDKQECTRNACADLYHNFNLQMMFFCPWHNPLCATKNATALSVAKRILRKHYVAVGILERWPETAKLLHATMPNYFRGVERMATPHRRRNDQKEEVSGSAMELLRHLNALDIEFYEYAQELFEEKLRAISKSPSKE